MHAAKRYKTILEGANTISISSDRSFPRHTHEEFAFGYMSSRGHETWSCQGLVEAHKGDVVTVNPGELHDGLGRKDEPRTWHMIHFSLEAVTRLTDWKPDRSEFHAPVLKDLTVSGLVRTAVDTAMNGESDPAELDQLLRLAFGKLLRRFDSRPAKVSPLPPIDRVLEQIHSEWSEPLTLDDLARTAGCSKFKTLRAFSRQIGTTPHAYLVQYRVNRARELLLHGVDAAEAAVACGFVDQSHMTRAFKRQVGLPPKQYLRAA